MIKTLPKHDVTTEKGLDAFLDEVLGLVGDDELEMLESTIGEESENHEVEFEFLSVERNTPVARKAA